MKIKIVLLTALLLAFSLIGLAQAKTNNAFAPESETYAGELQVGKTQSVILYFGAESGDYAAFCFKNNSAVGRAILAACKDKQQCQFTGEVTGGECKVPGLEADLSASSKIVSIKSVKSLAAKNSATGKTPKSSNKASAPDALIKNLYAAQKSGSGPFFQTRDRAFVDKYFRKDLADLIWKDAVAANGEVGAIDFDPLYGSQDPQISNFIIMETGWGGDRKFGGDDEAVVQVTFKDSGKERMVSYQFKRGKDTTWKIYDVHYRSDDGQVKLAEVLTKARAASQIIPASFQPPSKIETVEQLAKMLSEAFTANELGRLDAAQTNPGTVRIVLEHSITGEIESKIFKTFAAGEKWFKSREREDGPARNSGTLLRCKASICTYEQEGMLHNNLYLQKITYGYKKRLPYIKAIYVIDGD
ncbi:MAG: hypothetical protein H7Y30_17710 [Pyrinomonadaceae bacterium]|nr:hypothetical protein [Pyrinomonadaceae bacterium]